MLHFQVLSFDMLSKLHVFSPIDINQCLLDYNFLQWTQSLSHLVLNHLTLCVNGRLKHSIGADECLTRQKIKHSIP